MQGSTTTVAGALADPASSIHRKLAHARRVMDANTARLERLVADGHTREQAARLVWFGRVTS